MAAIGEYRDKVTTIGLAFLLMISGLIVGSAFGAITAAVGGSTISSLDGGLRTALSLLITDITLVAVGMTFLLATDRDVLSYVKARRPTARDLKIAAIGFLGLIAAIIFLSQIISMLGIETATNQIETVLRANPNAVFLLIPLTIFSVAPAEEFLFRGVIQSRVREDFSEWQTVLLVGVVFGLAHLFMYSGQGKYVNIAVLTAVALLLNVAYEKADSIVAPILMHAAYNTFQFVLLYVQIAGSAS